MARRNNRRQVKIKLSLKALIVVLILCIALLACYLFVPPVKNFVNQTVNQLTASPSVAPSAKPSATPSALPSVAPSVAPSTFNPTEIVQRGENDLTVHFIDVGQGDSIYIELPDGKNMLIDGGDKGYWDEVKAYLTALNVTTINYLMATHYDADHIGGLDEVFEYTTVETVYIPQIGENVITTNVYGDLMEAIEAEGSTVVYSKTGLELLSTDQDNQFRFLWLSPDQEFLDEMDGTGSEPDSLDKNNISPIMLLEYQDKQIVFTGDANVTVERDVLQNYEDGVYGDINLTDVEVLKAGHHGSNGTGSTTQIKSGSSCQEFLELLSPEYFIISAGEGNNHGHPHQPVLDRAEGVGAEIYRTDYHGSIIVTVRADITLPVEIATSVQGG